MLLGLDDEEAERLEVILCRNADSSIEEVSASADLAQLEDGQCVRECLVDHGSEYPHTRGGECRVLIGVYLKVGAPQCVGGAIGERRRWSVRRPT